MFLKRLFKHCSFGAAAYYGTTAGATARPAGSTTQVLP